MPQTISENRFERRNAIEAEFKHRAFLFHQRKTRREALDAELEESHSLTELEKYEKRHELRKQEAQILRMRRLGIGLYEYKALKVIGAGVFGEVRLVRKRDSSELYALKSLRKCDLVQCISDTSSQWECKSRPPQSDMWLIQLFASYQDALHLHLLLEYMPGGDLLSLLLRKHTLSEAQMRFYASETALAIAFLHKFKINHTGIRPEHLLLDARGHLKLTHCCFAYRRIYKQPSAADIQAAALPWKRMETTARASYWRKQRRQLACSDLGAFNYLAPEVIMEQQSVDPKQRDNCSAADWWSLGVLMYEMLFGYPPFCAANVQETCENILNWQQTLIFPADVPSREQVRSCITGLCAAQEQRLGAFGGLNDLKAMHFFRDVDWQNIRNRPSILPVENRSDETDSVEFNEFDYIPVELPLGLPAKKWIFIDYKCNLV